jgi:hypothetical protein
MRPMDMDRSLAFTVLLDNDADPSDTRISALVDAWLAQDAELHFWTFGRAWIAANPSPSHGGRVPAPPLPTDYAARNWPYGSGDDTVSN